MANPASIVAAMLASALLATAGRAQLFPGQVFPMPTGANHLVCLDLDGDGKLDATTANDYSNSVSVRLGLGGGLFGPRSDFAVGTQPNSIAVADLDQDGIPDLVTANATSHDLSVLLGDGHGDFTVLAPIAVGFKPVSVRLADMDADGLADIVVGDQSAASVAILFGQGGGRFSNPSRHGLEAFVFELAVADVNADASPDVLALTGAEQGLSILLNDGSGTLLEALQFDVGEYYPVHIAIGDLDADGFIDVATAAVNGAIDIAFGDGAGGFGPPTFKAVSADFVHTIAIGDANADSVPDVLVGRSWTFCNEAVVALLGDGAGGFPSLLTIPCAAPLAIATPDLDEDGAPDLLTSGSGLGLLVRLAKPGGGFEAGSSLFTYGLPFAFELADLNADDRLDAVVTDAYFTFGLAPEDLLTGNVKVYMAAADGSFGPWSQYIVGKSPEAVAVADLDFDTHPDIVTANHFASSVSVLLGDGSGSFGPALEIPLGHEPGDVAIGDVTADGRPDIIVGFAAPYATVFVLPGDGAGVFGEPLPHIVGPGGVVSLALDDLDGDGRLDVVTGNRGAQPNIAASVSVLLNSPSGLGEAATFAVAPFPQELVLRDLNGDAVSDLVLAGPNVEVRLGDGAGHFGSGAYFPAGQSCIDLSVGDLNGDVRPDLVLTATSYKASVLLGDGAGAFSPPLSFLAGYFPNDVAIADLDEDGAMDLVVLNQGNLGEIAADGTGFPVPSEGGPCSLTFLLNKTAPWPWSQVGDGLSGSGEVPALVGTGTLAAGSPTELTLTHAPPVAPAMLFVSLTSSPVPFKSGRLYAFPIATSLLLVTGPSGQADLAFTWPPGLPPGFELFFQEAVAEALAPSGVALSNALKAEQP